METKQQQLQIHEQAIEDAKTRDMGWTSIRALDDHDSDDEDAVQQALFGAFMKPITRQ